MRSEGNSHGPCIAYTAGASIDVVRSCRPKQSSVGFEAAMGELLLRLTYDKPNLRTKGPGRWVVCISTEVTQDSGSQSLGRVSPTTILSEVHVTWVRVDPV